ncbi:MAG: FG-GAP-like repeat-containing protein [Acidobacteriota bacterium]
MSPSRSHLLALALILVTSSTTRAAVQPPVLKWQKGGCTSWCQTGWYASPAVADLDGNGTKEVIWSSYSVYVVNGANGSSVWTVENGHDVASPGTSVGRTWPGVVVADIDGDGNLEIATAHSDGWVSVYDRQGYFKPGWPQQPTPGSELRTLAAYDLDGDGKLEVGVASTRDDDQWFIYNSDGTLRPGWPQLPAGQCCATGCFNENLALGDVTGDGIGEVIGPNDTHYVAAFFQDGTPIPANAMFGAGELWHTVGVWVPLAAEIRGYGNCGPEDRPNWNAGGLIVADVDGNGVNEVVGVGNVHDCSYSPYLDIYMGPWIWNGDRSRWSNGSHDWSIVPTPPAGSAPLSEDYSVIENVQPNVVAADLDGNGEMEILYPSYDGRLHCYRLDQTEPGNWPVEVYNPSEGFFRFASEPAVADLDNDGSAEVIFGDWPEKANGRVGSLHIADANGNEIQKVPLPVEPSDWNGILAAPTIDDIDGDADLEAVVGTSATGICAYDLPGTASARPIWPTGRGSYLRSGGYLASPPSVTAEFSGTPKIGGAPLAVTFTDLSSGSPSSWSWDFGDGTTSNVQSPAHTYAAPGLFTVSLTVTRATVSDSETKTNYINVTTGILGRAIAGPGPGPGNGNLVHVLAPDATVVAQFAAYGAGTFGTNVRAGSIAGPPLEMVLTGPGPGPVLGPQVRAFQGSGTPLAKVNYYAYGTLKFGVNVEGGDVEGDGFDEIVTGAGPGAVFGPHVRGWNYDNAALTAIAKISFFAYGTLKFGVNVASGSIDLDLPSEIVTGAGPGAIFAATVRGFNYDGASITAIQKVNFNAFPTTCGVNVATGGVDVDASSEIITGQGPGPTNPAEVRGWNYDGASVAALAGFDGTPFTSIYGVQVASGEMSGAAPEDVQAGRGATPFAGAQHAAYVCTGSALAPLGYADFNAFPGLLYGLKVGGGSI